MAEYSFSSTYYWIRNSTSSTGWQTGSFGSESFYISNNEYATKGIIAIHLYPSSGSKITSISLDIGVMGFSSSVDSTSVTISAHAYTSLSTAQSSYYGAPSGYISSAHHYTTRTDLNQSGYDATFTFSDLNITSNTTLYIRFMTNVAMDTSSKMFAVYTCAAGNMTTPWVYVSESTIANRTLSFSANSYYGSGLNSGSGAPAAISKPVGTAITIPYTAPTHPDLTSSSSFNIVGYKNDGSNTYQTITASKNITTPVTFAYEWTDYYYNAVWYSGSEWNMNESMTLYALYNLGSSTTSYSNNTLGKLTTPTRSGSTSNAYTVTFNANGGSCSTTSLTNQQGTTYTFEGWNTNSSGTGTTYTSSSTQFYSATNLYAKWKTNTGLTEITLPTPTRSGYNFVGWATSSTATTADVGVAGASYTPTANITLYAIWKSQSLTTKMWPHTVWIYNATAGKYEQYIPYVYSNSAWVQCGST